MKPRDSTPTTMSISDVWYLDARWSMTDAQAGPSLSKVVMSLKSIPSLGKSLISRIFALSSASSIAASDVTRSRPHDATRKSPAVRRRRTDLTSRLLQGAQDTLGIRRCDEQRAALAEVHPNESVQPRDISVHPASPRGPGPSELPPQPSDADARSPSHLPSQIAAVNEANGGDPVARDEAPAKRPHDGETAGRHLEAIRPGPGATPWRRAPLWRLLRRASPAARSTPRPSRALPARP